MVALSHATEGDRLSTLLTRWRNDDRLYNEITRCRYDPMVRLLSETVGDPGRVDVEQTVLSALAAVYRHFDPAKGNVWTYFSKCVENELKMEWRAGPKPKFDVE